MCRHELAGPTLAWLRPGLTCCGISVLNLHPAYLWGPKGQQTAIRGELGCL